MKFNSLPFLDLLSNIVDNRGKTCPTDETGIPLIATNCIKNNELLPVFEKVRYVSQETYDNWFRGHPEAGDLIFVTKGSPGRVCWVDDPKRFCIAQDMVAIRANDEVVYPKYLLALLRSESTQKQIENMHVGTLIPHFKKGDFDKLFLDVPDDMEYQKMVGDLYFDMALSTHQKSVVNSTLESIAQTLFKSWFVDFDPVRAKATARVNGDDPQQAAMQTISGKSTEELQNLSQENRQKLAATADLFPDELVETEHGEIPKGWEWIPLYDTAEYVNGGAFKSNEFDPDRKGLPIIKIAELKSGISLQTKFTAKEVPEKYAIDSGSLLYSWSGSPETSLEVFKWFGGKGWLNQHIFLINTISKEREVFVYNLLKQLKPTLIDIAKNKQTTGLGHVTVADMKRLNVAMPNAEGMNAVQDYLVPLYEMDSLNTLQNENLKNQRDALIPKLLSGELEIS